MGLFASECSINCRRVLDLAFLVLTVLSFAYFRGFIVPNLGAQITQDRCYQRVRAGNFREFM